MTRQTLMTRFHSEALPPVLWIRCTSNETGGTPRRTVVPVDVTLG